jgi:hypothetical protein
MAVGSLPPDESWTPHVFRETQTSGLTVYRCLECENIYNLYTGMVFEKKHLWPSQVVLLIRGAAKGGSPSGLVQEELSLSCTAVHYARRQLQTNTQRSQSERRCPARGANGKQMKCSRVWGKRREAPRPR